MTVKMAILIQHYKTAPDEHLGANNIAYVMKSEQKKQHFAAAKIIYHFK